MREYRAQLDSERALKLSMGRNYSSDKSRKGSIIKTQLENRTSKPFFMSKLLTVFSIDLTDKKDRDSKKTRNKKRKVLNNDPEQMVPCLLQLIFTLKMLNLEHYSSSESLSSSDEDESGRSRSRSKRSKKEKKHKSSRHKHSSKSKEETNGPVPLSRFFGNLKSWTKTCKRTIILDQNYSN